MRALEFIIGHMIYNPAYTYKFQLKTTIDDVYNTKFLEISPHVLNETRKSIERLSNGSVHIINLVIPKPDIPLDIAENYKQVIFHFAFKCQTLAKIPY